MPLTITITIVDCNDCRHRDHTGVATRGGAVPVCSHPLAVDYATKNKNPKGEDRYHYRHRALKTIDDKLGIPHWCPLQHGEGY